MKCNPTRWLWGLIPIAMLAWIAFNWERQHIEADLTRRTQEALGKSNLSWAKIKFSGRDGVLTGLAAEEGEPQKANEVSTGVWGVRVVDRRTDLMPKVDNYSWLATLNEGRLALSGYVPNEDVRNSVLGAAKSAFPKLAIDDAMELARGAPAQDVFLGGIGFGLKQLTHLNTGRISLDDTAFSIAGEAASSAAFKSANAALGGKLPNGIRLKSNSISPPVARVFNWQADLTNNKLTLAGHVPSEKAREDIFAFAKQRFSSSAIVDRMETAAGAPDGWPSAAMTALDQLANLEHGAVTTKASQLTVSGMAKDEGTAEAIRKTLRSKVPATFKTAERIEFPVVVVPPVDYDAIWREAEARWTDLEAKRPRPAEPEDDGMPWWKEAQQRLAAAPEEASPGGVNLDLKFTWGTEENGGAVQSDTNEREIAWRAYEERWALIAAEHERQRAEKEARDAEWLEREERWAEIAAAYARQKAAEDERQRAWLEAEERWALQNAEYQRRRAKEEEERLASMVSPEVREEVDRCQALIGDAVKKGRILFKTSKADLDSRSAPTLNQLAKIANACPRARVDISGHTDSDGARDMNMALSERRAQSVVDFLTKAGVDASRLSAKGYGPTRPVAPNDTAQNKSKNRRIEFSVVPN